MKEKYGEKFEYVWVYRNSSKPISAEGLLLVKTNTLKMLYMMNTSKVIIVNTGLSRIYPMRKNQLLINTWHAGGAYKKIESTLSDKSSYGGKKPGFGTRNYKSIVLSSSSIFTKYNILRCNDNQDNLAEIWNCGMPRNDIFFSNKKILQVTEKVRHNLQIKGASVLYAPTFRNISPQGECFDVNIIDFRQLKEACRHYFGSDVTILVRAHPDGKLNMLGEDDLIDVTDYPDMQELLCASDILITDYSSSIWDYALLGRPCFLYVPDLEKYKTNRGFFTPIETWPGIICHDIYELCYEIEHLNKERCREIAKNHLEYAGSYEQGTACETVCKNIVDFCSAESSPDMDTY